MPHAQRSYDYNDQSRRNYELVQSFKEHPCRRHQPCNSQTSYFRDESRERTQTRVHHRHHRQHPHPYRSNQQSHKSQHRNQNIVPINSECPVHSEHLYSTVPSGSTQKGRSKEKQCINLPGTSQDLQKPYRHRQPKSSSRRLDRSMQTNQVMIDVDSRMMRQWNTGRFDTGKSAYHKCPEMAKPEGHQFPHTPNIHGYMTESQLRALNNFNQKKSQSNQDFTIPKSSLDNLLGIDAMDMYITENPFYGKLQFQSQGGFPQAMPSGAMTDMETNLGGPGNRLADFQHNCIRSLASMIVCPHTVLPITVGLFTQSGSIRDTGYLQVLGEEISHINSVNPYQFQINRIRFSLGSSMIPLVATFLIAYILGLALGWQLGLAVAVTATVLYFVVCVVVLLGMRGKHCSKSMQFAETLSRYMRGCQLILNILFYRAPAAPSSAKPVRLLPISLNLPGCLSGVEAVAQMTEKLWQFAEQKYGRVAVRFQWASKDAFHRSPQTFRKYCCLPLWLWLLLSIVSTLSLATIFVVYKEKKTKDSIEVTHKPPTVTAKDLIHHESDIHLLQEHLISVAIVCAVLSGFSTLALLAASGPTVIRLLQGRPFQRRKQSTPYGDEGKLNEPPMDGCYGTNTNQCDPVSCMRFDGKLNGRFDGHEQFPMHLTSAATVAATAAVAAVTAADRQWRKMEQENAQLKQSSHNKLRKSSGIKAVRQLFSPSKTVPQAAKDLESHSTDNSSQSRSGSSSDGEEHNAYSRSQTDNEDDVPEGEHTFYQDAVMFESGELLIRDQHRGKRLDIKKETLLTPGKRSLRTEGSKSVNTQKLVKWKNLIRKGFMEACKVLSLIDSRMGDRQTRVVFCINANNGLPVSPASLVKLATFVRLVDRLAMQPPTGGTSNDAPVIFSSYKSGTETNNSEQKNLNPNASATTWTPNIIILLTASVPYAQTVNNNQFNIINSIQSQPGRDGSKSCSFLGNPSNFPWTNFKLWWSVHHACHLPIYLEEEPPGHRLTEPTGAQHVSRIPQVLQSFHNSTGQTSIFELLLGSHDLSDMNAKCLRRMLTQIAFMGRMINIERLQIERHGLVRIATSDSVLSSGHVCTDTLITWLCLLQHWPFHAAWLAVFIEQHLCKNEDGINVEQTETNTPRRLIDGTASYGSETDAINQINWDSVLSQLHARILKRLAPAVEIARIKAMSVSLGASQIRMDFNTHQSAAYPPHVNSTLEICDLAMRDRDPRRLAEFLNSNDTDRVGVTALGDSFTLSGAFHPRIARSFKAGAVTVRQLIRVMRLTPMMNPQINQWIRDVLSSKLLMAENTLDARSEKDVECKRSSGEALINQQISSPRTIMAKEKRNSRGTAKHFDMECRVKLKHGMPSKRLSQMTVDDICILIRNIADLSVNRRPKRKSDKVYNTSKSTKMSGKAGELLSSGESESPINDPVPPAPISEKHKPSYSSHSLYEERIRKLNISGTVLSICSLSDLQKELNMSFGDWQLFSSLISYLKFKELSDTMTKPTTPNHTSGFQQTENLQRSDPRLFSRVVDQTGKWPQESRLISTVSDTSLALTVKSVPVTNQRLSSPPIPMSSAVKITKSMSALSSGSRTGTGLQFANSTQRLQHVLCPQHSRTMQEMYMKDRAAVFCPKHQEQVKSLLSGSQRELGAFPESSKRSQTDTRLKSAFESRTLSLKQRHTCGAEPKQATTGYPLMGTAHSLQQNKQAQFQIERSRTLPNSFRQTLPVNAPNAIHAQYCAMHQKYMQPNWSHSSQSAWLSSKDSREENATGRPRGMLEPTIQTERATMDYMSISNRAADRSQGHRLVRSQAASTEVSSKETQAFDLNTPVRQHLSKLNYISPSSGQFATAEFCLPKDSESTSIAGDLIEEVAEFSPAQPEPDDSVSPDVTIKEEDKLDTSDHPSSHSCDCNYWYSLEAAAAAAAGGGGGLSNTGSITPNVATTSPKILPYQGFGSSREQSISDSLSTTRSQLDASSGTSTDVSTSDPSSNEQLDKLG